MQQVTNVTINNDHIVYTTNENKVYMRPIFHTMPVTLGDLIDITPNLPVVEEAKEEQN